jgi:porin
MGKSSRFWVWGSLCVFWAGPAAAQGVLGDMGGLRTALGNDGVTLGITDSENLLGDPSGGLKRGATMEGVTTATLEMDTSKAFGWQGGTIHVSALQIHGRSFSQYYLGDLQAANGNEGDDATRLWELWVDQVFDFGRADVKLGQQSIDNEFMVSTYSGLFVNTMAGWPLVPSDDLYAGGPAYPLSSLGGRVQYKPADNTTILAGVFDDNPPGDAFDNDPQEKDVGGVRFNLNTGALFIAELQYVTNQPSVGEMVQPGQAGLAGTYKIGFWYDTAGFADQRFGTDGLSLANPGSNGNPRAHHGNYSVYGVVDQTVWQAGSRNINVFGRIMGAPDAENLIDFFANGGVTVTAPLPGRDNDMAGVDFGIGRVSSRAAGLDADAGLPKRGTEELFEMTYQAQATPWLVVQPDVQYVVHPGGGVLDPNDPSHQLRNEFVAGVRAIVTF